ncbi:septal ring lytic transglycosylase RlpA family protein [Aliagarivorans taiwanensis]|uniref:septal ring lytic transglycosylase RlpA family protein n=1 Tax=Aliagarivorans taiwanensis TaxID=561966 RepID=UPI00041B65F5|nr:septal ring lytic transglycosylase RlpA family protein [Aliagarivorans taiwanensis]
MTVKTLLQGAAVLTTAALLAACSGSSSRYSMRNDTAPTQIPDLQHIESLTPRDEPMSAQGNRDYKVRGKSYQVWRDIEEYQQQGEASWYGKKFHGHLTSNGEIYDMYSLSAAHKNLPLPSYVQVTNLANDKSVVVRVNDRGPFHGDRIIDLSYAAAHKLDMLKSGVGKVEVKLLRADQNNSPAALAFIEQHQYYVQLMASRQQDSLLAHQLQLEQLGLTSEIIEQNGWQKLRLGPYNSRRQAEQDLALMHQGEYGQAFIVQQDLN